MLTKRTAIIALFSGVMAKMAHADQPLPDAGASKPIIPTVPYPPGDFGRYSPTPSMVRDMEAFNRPTTWTVNLDQMKSLDVYLGGKKVTILPADIFAALS